MKHMKQVKVPENIKFVVDYTTCEICRNKIENELYEVNEVTIKHKTGNSYPDGGSGETTSVDMCGKCFREVLVPWLQSKNANVETKEWDW